MITRATTLILGAGASPPFNNPLLGGRLYSEVCAELRNHDSQFFNLLRECGFSDDDLAGFRHALFHSGKTSIDAFLEGRAEDNAQFVEIGKVAIAARLIPLEADRYAFELS